jgi:fructokinase
MTAMRIGIDLGGTKIEGVALDDCGAVLARRRIPAPQMDYRATVNAIAGLALSLEDEAGIRGTVGVGTPGAISPATGVIKNANSTHLIGHPLHRDLARALDREVRVANDANCFALSEVTDGAATGVAVVFGVILGTGTGAGVVVNGRALTGPNAIAGEWGHNPLPWPRPGELPGPPCYCGHTGCIETFLSGPGLVSAFYAATGRRLPSPEIVAAADAGDSHAERCLRTYEDRLARGLAHVINILDPDVIVLGGGMSNIQRLYANVPKSWARYVFSDRVDTRLVPPAHGDASGVRGAAWLWP